ncbi:molybdopterin cofactor-binding domain-containing protein [Cetobacterium sp. SF1]|uniref:molybdopterin cofactor-binding domain-containing protein n=1 Tax=Cetobacterium sp. SF1 TaxID=3417654 RepID=UPI003CFBB7BA
MDKIKFILNGVEKEFLGNRGDNAKVFLRNHGIITMREGCDGEGNCGLCSIILDGKVVNSCLLIVGQLEGREVYTTEFFSNKRDLNTLQKAMVMAGVVQCGYCSPSIYLALNTLLKVNANPSKEDVKDALSSILCRCTGYEQMFDVITIYNKLLNNEIVDEEKILKEMRVVEKSVCKMDGPKLVRGEKAFVEDYVDPDACILKVLGSPYASAYINDIDVSEAEKVPGVVYILTYKNSPDKVYGRSGQSYPEPSPYDRRIIGQKVYHVGDRVAAVLAETEEAAIEAIKLIKVDYEVLKPVATLEEAMAEDAPIIHNGHISYGTSKTVDNSNIDPREVPVFYNFPVGEDVRKNKVASSKGGMGDVEIGFQEADCVIERTYRTKKAHCTPSEPHVVYSKMVDGRLVVHASTQVPWHARRVIASILDIPENKIRVIKENVGGGFGAKQDMLIEDLSCYLTWITGRGVYYRFTREEEFIAGTSRHDMIITVKLGAKKDGKITAIQMDVKSNTGAFGNHALTVSKNVCNVPLPLFIVPNIKFNIDVYYSNLPNAGAYRGYGAPQGTFALMTAIDELSHEMGLEYSDILKKNTVRSGDKLELLAQLAEIGKGNAEEIASCALIETMEKAMELIDWKNKPKSKKDHIKIGHGMAIVQQKSGIPDIDTANAMIKMLNDGTFIVHMGGTDLGTGLNTVSAQLAAEHLQTDFESVHIIAADTDNTPFDVGAYASSGTHFSCGAVLNAVKKMETIILEAASEMLKEDVKDLKLAYPSKVVGKTGEVTYEQIAFKTQSGKGKGQLIAHANFTTSLHAFPYGTHICEVAVNTNTGEVKINKYYAIHDCGVPINPKLAKGQIFGAVIQSIGHSLYEEMKFDQNAKPLNANLLDYKVAKINDIPEDFRVEFVYTAEENEKYGPRKSVGEISINGAAPALATAIHDATGVWVREWPFSPESILKALGKI